MRAKDTDIIKVMIGAEGDLNISKISEHSGIDYKNTHNILKRLEKRGLVKFETFGKSKKCILVERPSPLVFEAETERREEFLRKHRNIGVLHDKLKSLNFPFIALVFGSYARGRQDRHSDIDVLVISEKKRHGKIDETVRLLPLKIHLTPITFEDFVNMLRSREFTVVSEAVKSNIIITGIEDYYRVIENAG